LYLKPDGAWHLTPEQVEWLKGAAEREAALRAERDELRAEVERLKKQLADRPVQIRNHWFGDLP
jgi:hypothetical protein